MHPSPDVHREAMGQKLSLCSQLAHVQLDHCRPSGTSMLRSAPLSVLTSHHLVPQLAFLHVLCVLQQGVPRTFSLASRPLPVLATCGTDAQSPPDVILQWRLFSEVEYIVVSQIRTLTVAFSTLNALLCP
jgi:hypothetical protein